MSYLFTSSSFPKVRQEGFHTGQGQPSVGTLGSGLAAATGSGTGTPAQQSIPAPNAFDPNSIYTTGALFADAYRATQADPFARRYEQTQQQQQQQQNNQQQQSSSLDIHDELGFMHPPNSATSESFQQQRPHDIFGVNQPHYPSLSLPHSRALYSRDDFSSTTPASLHNSYGRSDYFPTNGPSNSTTNNPNASDGSRNPNELTPQQIQQQQQFGLMSSSLANSAAAAAAAAASLDNFNPGGEQAASSGVTRSRSRSRSKVSASRSRVSKRPSLPAPPHEEGGESPDSSRAQSTSRPSAIVIPGHSGHPGHHGSHSFSSFHTSTTHPASPVTWGYPSHVNPNGDYGEGSAGHQLFGQSFGGAASLGPGQSPTTHNSGSPPTSATMDAATKLALANEKRRKRRESHNAVERRRRDNINEKIQELALLLPEEWLETANPTGGTTTKTGGAPGGGSFGQGPSLAGLLSGTVSGSALAGDDDSKEIKANKGVILRNSVEYIKNLMQLVQVQRSRNDQLESELAQYRNRYGNINGASNGSNTMSINNGGISPAGGLQSTSHTDDDASTMAGYVLHSMNSPEGFDMKMFGSSVGPLDTLGSSNLQGHASNHGHGHTLSSGNMGMEGVETSPSNQMGLARDEQLGMMGMTGMHGMHSSSSNHNPTANPGSLGVSAILMDTTSPSTGSGEGDEVEEDEPRGRKTTRFPAGVGKQEDEVLTL